MIVSAVPKEHVVRIWPQVSGYLDKATRTVRMRASVPDLFEACLKGEQVLWVVADEDKEILTGFVTQLLVYPQYRALAVQFLGGKRMKEWLDPAIETINRYAGDLGCETIEGYGREAWIRWLRPRGFRKAYAVFEKEVK